jgi:hypothetical protein
MEIKDKKIKKLSAELNSFIINNSNERFSQGIKLQEAWEAIAPPQALEHTDNVVFSQKTNRPCVFIYVEDSRWAAELGMQRELYRILLEKKTGWEIHELKFYVTRKAMFKKFFKKQKEKTQQKKTEKTAVPLTGEEDGYARELVSPIKDKRLQERLYKAIKADFEWKKGNEGLKLP